MPDTTSIQMPNMSHGDAIEAMSSAHKREPERSSPPMRHGEAMGTTLSDDERTARPGAARSATIVNVIWAMTGLVDEIGRSR